MKLTNTRDFLKSLFCDRQWTAVHQNPFLLVSGYIGRLYFQASLQLDLAMWPSFSQWIVCSSNVYHSQTWPIKTFDVLSSMLLFLCVFPKHQLSTEVLAFRRWQRHKGMNAGSLCRGISSANQEHHCWIIMWMKLNFSMLKYRILGFVIAVSVRLSHHFSAVFNLFHLHIPERRDSPIIFMIHYGRER